MSENQGGRTLPFGKGRVLPPWTPYLPRKPLCRVRPAEGEAGAAGSRKKKQRHPPPPLGGGWRNKAAFFLKGAWGKILLSPERRSFPHKNPVPFVPLVPHSLYALGFAPFALLKTRRKVRASEKPDC